ncbi:MULTISPECIES: DUF3348 family protein [unclassified Luteimonas]|nr:MULTISPECIES: DUF3348 family protein [unclassified Luteimonas]MBJ6978439.1 DUF3348 family protein [Luteimonas sp. MC1895]MBJ6983335.1 DUF3348 family protein [Luteimonas sp. MC1750]QQO06195.1 DUF3348 family protein [Luteimonas sp. MC1750]
MHPDPTRAPISGAALARLSARLAGQACPAPPKTAPADVLGDWLDWQRAVALSRALDDDPAADDAPAATWELPRPQPAAPPASLPCAEATDAGLEAESRAARDALEAAILEDSRDWTRPLHPRAGGDGSADAGAVAIRQHCQGLQRDLQATTGRLRGELRERLAQRGGGAARLAAADAVMEGVLAPREHALLAPLVPSLVVRFEQLHARAAAADSDAGGQAPLPWRDHFRAEARQVLLAELDLRFQPIEALLAALRTSSPSA